MSRLLGKYGPPLVLAALVVAFWQFACDNLGVAPYLLPAPTEIVKTIVESFGDLWPDVLVTAREILFGFSLAVVAGVVIALLLHVSPFARRTVFPILVGSQTIPIVVFAPILVLVLGFGLAPKLVIVGLICFFPIVISMVDGLQSVDPSMRDMMRTLNGNRSKTLIKVELPAALPSTFSGLRIAATYAAIGAVFGEWSGASEGLGFLIQQSAASSETALMYAAVVLLCVMAFLLVGLVSLAERLLIPWAPRFANR